VQPLVHHSGILREMVGAACLETGFATSNGSFKAVLTASKLLVFGLVQSPAETIAVSFSSEIELD